MMFEKINRNYLVSQGKDKNSDVGRPFPDRPFLATSHLICEECGSENIDDNGSGYYVCQCCGLTVEDMQIYKFNTPFEEEKVQNLPFTLKNSTLVGNKSERRKFSNSLDLERLAKMQNIARNYENSVNIAANAEFKRLLEALHLPMSLLRDCMEVHKQIRKKLVKGTRARSPEKLAPAVLFMVLKVKAIVIDNKFFTSVLSVDRDIFREVLVDAAIHYKPYLARDRRPLILNRVQELKDYFGLSSEFLIVACECLKKLWEFIKNTKDDVVAGVVSTLAVLALDIDSVSVSNICDKLEIRMSTINYQMKRKIFETMEKPGFTSLMKSSVLVKDLVMQTVFGRFDDSSESKEISGQEGEDEIIVINPKDWVGHRFNVSLEGIKSIKGFEGIAKLFIFSGESINFSSSFEDLLEKGWLHPTDFKRDDPCLVDGKGPPDD